MKKSRLTLLKADRRTTEFKEWSPWMEALGSLIARFDEELTDDPLSYNETASVSLLAAAAAMAGYLGIAEFSVVKGQRGDRRRAAPGRCDFWMATSTTHYGFEFKQSAPLRLTERDLRKSMKAAWECARCLRAGEADVRVAGVVVSLWHHDLATVPQATAMLERLATEADYAWRIAGAEGGETGDAFLFFDVIED